MVRPKKQLLLYKESVEHFSFIWEEVLVNLGTNKHDPTHVWMNAEERHRVPYKVMEVLAYPCSL